MKTALVYISPLDLIANARVDFRVADAGNAADMGIGGVVWEPAIVTRPMLSVELFAPDMNGSIQPGRLHVEINLGQVRTFANPEKLYWSGAPITLQADGVLEGPTAIPDFSGYVVSASYDKDTNRLVIDANVSTKLFEKPLLTRLFGGGGGIDGDAGFRGTLLPAAFGAVKNIEPVWFDATRNIGMLDGYDNCLTIDWLGEGLASFGPAVADYATYALLAAAIDAAAVAPGQWATCVAKGLVGLGAPSNARISVHATFGFGTPGTWVQRILVTHAGVAIGSIDVAALNALDIALAALLPNDGACHYWTGQQRQIPDLLTAIARCFNSSIFVTPQGLISMTRAIFSHPVLALDIGGGGDPRVLNWKQNSPQPPVYVMSGRAARPASVFATSDVNYKDTIIDRGLYNGATIYQAGNIVWLGNGEEHLYINDTPAAGHLPPVPVAVGDSDAWWECLKLPTTYTDGTPIDDVQPRDPGATRNDDGANMLPSPVLLDRVMLANSAVRSVVIGAAGRPADRYRILLAGHTNSEVWWDFDPVPVVPGEKLYYHHVVKTDVSTADTTHAAYETYDITGALLATIQLPETLCTGAEAIGAFVLKPTSFIVPAGVASVKPLVNRAAWSTIGTFYVGEPYLGRSQPGADVTAINEHVFASIADILCAADSTGTLGTGVLPQSRLAARLLGAVDVSASTDYVATISGGLAITLNNTPGDVQRGLITVTNQAIPLEATITVTSTYLGIALTQTFKLLRQDAPPAGGGGGGGGGSPGAPASIYSFTPPALSGSYITMGTIAAVTTGSAGTLTFTAGIDYTAATQGVINPSVDPIDDTTLVLLAEYSTNGGSAWTAAGATATGTDAEHYYSSVVPKGNVSNHGYVSFSRNITGLGSGTSVLLRLRGYNGSGAHSIDSSTGFATATPT